VTTLPRGLRLFIALAVLAFTAAPAAAATCPYQARCGSITVPLDHSGATPGTLPIGYAILPATGPKTGTIFFLSGGPGESAVVFTGMVRKELAPLRRTHDIVMVDQREPGDRAPSTAGTATARGPARGSSAASARS
jgi:pimeloyl-ACP methyl ester carboxylesterase